MLKLYISFQSLNGIRILRLKLFLRLLKKFKYPLRSCRRGLQKVCNLGDLLDRDDFIDDSYILEVSSPGLGRPLKKERDFIRSKGEEVEIRTYRMVDRQKEFRGVLKAWDRDTVTIETEDGQEQIFDRDNIALIRLAFDF